MNHVTPPRVEGTIAVAARRRLSFAEFGPPDGRAVVWLHGTPGARRLIPAEARLIADAMRLRIIGIDRPGIGSSTPHLYRSILDDRRVLVLLEEHGALSVTAVAGGLGVDQSNASRHCSRLVRLGLACRSRASHDRRAVEVRLTARGRTHVQAVREARRREIVRVLDRLPQPSVEAVAQAFALFHEAARAEDRDGD